MTSWALLALGRRGPRWKRARAPRAGVPRSAPARRWSFPEEHIAGMFNKTCAIHYDNYLKVFPVWAMSVLRASQRP
jgi:squalene cyclase